MTRRIVNQSQDEIESMRADEEQPGRLLEAADQAEEPLRTGSNDVSRAAETATEDKREAASINEQTNNQAEIDESRTENKSSRKAASGARKKAPQPRSSATVAAKTSTPKQATTRKRRTPHKSAPSVEETEETQVAAGEEAALVSEHTSPAEELATVNEETNGLSKKRQIAETPETASQSETSQEEEIRETLPPAAEIATPPDAESLTLPASGPIETRPEPLAGEDEPPEREELSGPVEEVSPAGEALEDVVLPGANEVTPDTVEQAKEIPARDEEEKATTGEVVPRAEESALVPTGVVDQRPAAVLEITAGASATTERGHLVRSAALVSIGNLGSSLLGMVRQIVVTGLGNSVAGPFNAALAPVNNFYQLLVNGSTDGALIPVFNEYASEKKRDEMRRVVFTVVNLVGIIALISSIIYLLIAPWFVSHWVAGYSGADRALTLQFSQIIFFSLVILGPFAVLLAALFSLKEFGWPAFATAAYHAGIIMGATVFSLLGMHAWGLIALPIGLLIGSAGQIALLLPGIRRRKLYYMFVLDLKHPALKRIYHLYWPIAISFVFSTAVSLFDLHLQSLTPQHAAATTAMSAATTLIQFPAGLVAQALSIAVLPTLSEHAREGNTERFKETLLLGIRLGLLLMIPAMTGLLVLRTPIMYAIFAHHNYSLVNADLSALALQNYAYQLPFIAIDQLMIAAFYARKNTKVPVTIYIVSIVFYLMVALPFYGTIGVAALAFANAFQNAMHAVILLILLRMAIGSLHLRRAISSVLKICIAAVLMALVAWGTMLLLGHVELFSLHHLLGQILTLIVAGGLASAVYFGAILLFGVEEISLVKGTILAKLGKK